MTTPFTFEGRTIIRAAFKFRKRESRNVRSSWISQRKQPLERLNISTATQLEKQQWSSTFALIKYCNLGLFNSVRRNNQHRHLITKQRKKKSIEKLPIKRLPTKKIIDKEVSDYYSLLQPSTSPYFSFVRYILKITTSAARLKNIRTFNWTKDSQEHNAELVFRSCSDFSPRRWIETREWKS